MELTTVIPHVVWRRQSVVSVDNIICLRHIKGIPLNILNILTRHGTPNRTPGVFDGKRVLRRVYVHIMMIMIVCERQTGCCWWTCTKMRENFNTRRIVWRYLFIFYSLLLLFIYFFRNPPSKHSPFIFFSYVMNKPFYSLLTLWSLRRSIFKRWPTPGGSRGLIYFYYVHTHTQNEEE